MIAVLKEAKQTNETNKRTNDKQTNQYITNGHLDGPALLSFGDGVGETFGVVPTAVPLYEFRLFFIVYVYTNTHAYIRVRIKY